MHMTSSTEKLRLDQLLVERGLVASRSRARDAIIRGCVRTNGVLATKVGQTIAANTDVQVFDPGQKYVSRAALKLITGLDIAEIDVRDKHALDLGASTGGFTQVLLERGAKSVLALDVGHGQLVEQIADDKRVTNREGFNARHLKAGDLTTPPSIIVSDMSFVSLTIAAEPALRLSASKANCVLLVKPQFEVGKEGIGKGGLVKSSSHVDAALEKIKIWFSGLPGWSMTHLVPSPIKGGDGNLEYLLCGQRNG